MLNSNALNGRKVLVTGGAGFIGSNLIERLLDMGAQVVCLDNLSTGNRENIRHWEALDTFQFIMGDIGDLATCERACQDVDVVFHQAALGSVPRSVENPIPTHQTNATGFINMLQAASKSGIKRFVYASSSSVYGDHPELPKVEGRIGNHLSPYAVTKYSNELNAKVFGGLYGMETIGLRYFNVFGENQDPQGAYAAVIPKFVKSILAQKTIEIHGDGLQSRDFTYIQNVVDVNILAALTDNEQAFNTIFNVAYGAHIELVELLDMIIEKVKKIRPDITRVRVKHVATRKGDIKHSYADISKAIQLLGYHPSIGLEEGMLKTIQYYIDLLTKQNSKPDLVPTAGVKLSSKTNIQPNILGL